MVVANSLLLALKGSSPNFSASEPSAELRWLTLPSGVREGQELTPAFGDQAAEGMEAIPISFVVGIAEIGIGSARVEGQREVDHFAGITTIERLGRKTPCRR